MGGRSFRSVVGRAAPIGLRHIVRHKGRIVAVDGAGRVKKHGPQVYDSVRKLKPQEFSYLYFYLAYPEKFWKIANHYSQSHKAWLSGRNTEKLSKVITQEGAREHFLQTLAGKVENRI